MCSCHKQAKTSDHQMKLMVFIRWRHFRGNYLWHFYFHREQSAHSRWVYWDTLLWVQPVGRDGRAVPPTWPDPLLCLLALRRQLLHMWDIPLKYEHLLHSWLNACNQDDVLVNMSWRRTRVCLIGWVLVGRRERSTPLDTERHSWPWKQKVTEQPHLKVHYWAVLVLYSLHWLSFPSC